MTYFHQLLHIPFDKLTDTNKIFEEYSHVDLNRIPKSYGNKVLQAQQLIKNNLQLNLLYASIPISRIENDLVELETGNIFSSTLLPKVLKDSQEIVCYIITLTGYTTLAETVTNKLLGYFLDIWSSAFIESAKNYFKHHIDQDLSTTKLKRTYLWSPGFKEFSLENQQTLFHILKPDCIGCTLNDYYHMLPSKSTSGILGIIPKEKELNLKPCNFCNFNEKCADLQKIYCY